VTGGKIEFYDAKRHNLHYHPPVIVAVIKSDIQRAWGRQETHVSF